ncbi:hypothetical protein IWZ01DRAFT_526815 [Phyllosticta capitalensis]
MQPDDKPTSWWLLSYQYAFWLVLLYFLLRPIWRAFRNHSPLPNLPTPPLPNPQPQHQGVECRQCFHCRPSQTVPRDSEKKEAQLCRRCKRYDVNPTLFARQRPQHDAPTQTRTSTIQRPSLRRERQDFDIRQLLRHRDQPKDPFVQHQGQPTQPRKQIDRPLMVPFGAFRRSCPGPVNKGLNTSRLRNLEGLLSAPTHTRRTGTPPVEEVDAAPFPAATPAPAQTRRTGTPPLEEVDAAPFPAATPAPVRSIRKNLPAPLLIKPGPLLKKRTPPVPSDSAEQPAAPVAPIRPRLPALLHEFRAPSGAVAPPKEESQPAASGVPTQPQVSTSTPLVPQVSSPSGAVAPPMVKDQPAAPIARIRPRLPALPHEFRAPSDAVASPEEETQPAASEVPTQPQVPTPAPLVSQEPSPSGAVALPVVKDQPAAPVAPIQPQVPTPSPAVHESRAPSGAVAPPGTQTQTPALPMAAAPPSLSKDPSSWRWTRKPTRFELWDAQTHADADKWTPERAHAPIRNLEGAIISDANDKVEGQREQKFDKNWRAGGYKQDDNKENVDHEEITRALDQEEEEEEL